MLILFEAIFQNAFPGAVVKDEAVYLVGSLASTWLGAVTDGAASRLLPRAWMLQRSDALTMSSVDIPGRALPHSQKRMQIIDLAD